MSKKQELNSIDKYNKIVADNVGYLNSLEDIKKKFNKNSYKDPDLVIKKVKVNDIDIDLATDGLCGINKIIEFSEEASIVSNYKLIRNDYLLWPAYAMSINQQRGYTNVCDDRIDLLMCDLQIFFEIINTKNNSYYEYIKEIKEKCKLYRAYLNVFTFMWLKSFGTFDKFIEDNKYEKFVKKSSVDKDGKIEEIYIAERWNDTNKFDKDYFEKLLERLA